MSKLLGRDVEWKRVMGERKLLVAGTIWVVAIFLLIGATQQAQEFAEVRALPASEANPPKVFDVTKSPLSKAEYERLAQKYRKLFESVEFAPQNNGIEITANSGSGFDNWERAVQSIIQSNPQYRWNYEDICVGSECKGNPFSAKITGTRVQFR